MTDDHSAEKRSEWGLFRSAQPVIGRRRWWPDSIEKRRVAQFEESLANNGDVKQIVGVSSKGLRSEVDVLVPERIQKLQEFTFGEKFFAVAVPPAAAAFMHYANSVRIRPIARVLGAFVGVCGAGAVVLTRSNARRFEAEKQWRRERIAAQHHQ